MPDTIRFNIPSAILKPEYRPPAALPAHWQLIESIRGPHNRAAARKSTIIKSVPLGITLFGSDLHFRSVEACLPKLLWGHNGRVIDTPELLQTAMKWLEWWLRTVLEPNPCMAGFVPGLSPGTLGDFTRIDIAWQFPRDQGIRVWLQHMEHPRIRKAKRIHENESVTLPGSRLRIVAYDKVKQMRLPSSCDSEVDRLEFQLRNPLLKDYAWASGEGTNRITLAWCIETAKQVTRELMGRMARPTVGRGISAYLQYVQSHYPRIDHLGMYAHFKQLKPGAIRKLRHEMAEHAAMMTILPPADALFVPGRAVCVIDLPTEQAHLEWVKNYSAASAMTA